MNKIIYILGFCLIFLGLPAHGLPPTCPKAGVVVTATPVYSTPPAIRVNWVDQPSETSYEIWRAVGAGTPARVNAPAANATTWMDTAVNNSDNFTYEVRACSGVTCTSIGTFTTSVTSTFPVAAGEVLHGFNEVIAWAGVRGGDGVTSGYHDGVDINRSTTGTTPGDDVLASRGGTITLIDSATPEANTSSPGVVPVVDRLMSTPS